MQVCLRDVMAHGRLNRERRLEKIDLLTLCICVDRRRALGCLVNGKLIPFQGVVKRVVVEPDCNRIRWRGRIRHQIRSFSSEAINFIIFSARSRKRNESFPWSFDMSSYVSIFHYVLLQQPCFAIRLPDS